MTETKGVDMHSIAAEAMTRLIASGKIEAAVTASVEKTVIEAVHEHLRSWSDFGKMVKEAVERSIAFERVDLPSYNAIVLDTLRQHIDATMRKESADSLKKLADEMLRTPPKSMKLSELVDAFKEWVIEHNDRSDLDEEISVVVNKRETKYSTSWVSTYWYVGLHPKANQTSEYSCDWRFMLRQDEVTKEITLSSVWHNGKDRGATSNLFLGDFYGFERKLFQLYSAKTAIIIDQESVDPMLPEPECECA